MKQLARSPEQIGNFIRRARKKLGLSQSELGERASLRQASISLLESGNPAIRLDNLLTVLAVLDLELSISTRSHASLNDLEDWLD
ncbi:helix-turn-helix domain-containing protein [Brucellaceae bacterium C25G]